MSGLTLSYYSLNLPANLCCVYTVDYWNDHWNDGLLDWALFIGTA